MNMRPPVDCIGLALMLDQSAPLTESRAAERAMRAAARGLRRIDAHLAQTAQAVDVVVLRARMNGKAWQYYAPDYLSSEAISKLAGYGWEFERLARALSGEKAGAVGGIAMAAAYIQKKADDYAAENCGTEWDTGATTYRYGQAGEDYHHTLLELAEEIAALPASPAPDKEGQP